MDWEQKLRYMAKQYAAGMAVRGGSGKHYLEETIEELDQLRAEVKHATGKTARRCIEMAMWPQGIDDEQAYYGRMFAEFIEKEFKGALDALKGG